MSSSSISSNSSIKNGKTPETSEKKKRTFREFCRKYFLDGQQLDQSATVNVFTVKDQKLCDDQNTFAGEMLTVPFHVRYRKYIGFAIPFVFMHLVWWTLAFRYNIFRLYPTRWPMAVTMVVGAIIGGATSEGGGAVAFPVMTLLLHIGPVVARDFSLMIQSAGMTSASFTILWMRILIEWHSVIFCSLGATVGIILGLQFIDDLFDGPTKKMLFVSIWLSFAIALFLLNRQPKRVAHLGIQNFCTWKAITLVFTGFVGGLCSSLSGSGVDICSFSILTLLFRVSEKVATPTSVILMAANTLVGFFWRHLIQQGISTETWEYFQVCVPVVVIFAPLGAFLSSHLHRQVLALMVYVLETLALIGFLITRPSASLIAIGAGIIVFSFFFFASISRLGQLLNQCEQRRRISPKIEEGKSSSPSGDTKTTTSMESSINNSHNIE